jgi:transposase
MNYKPENRSTEPKAKTEKTRVPRLKGKEPGAAPTRRAEVIKVGVDVGLTKYAVCRQVDGSLPDPPRMQTPEGFKTWLLEQRGLAVRVVVCYEAGLFGFELARWVVAQGMECLVMAPVRLDEKNKRVETDGLNARDIGSRLDRYLAGNTRALTVCRIPTEQEELLRQQTRQREQLVEHRKSMEAQGRSLLWQFGYLREGRCRWWREPFWQPISQGVIQDVRRALERLRAVILELVKQLEQLEVQLLIQATQDLPEVFRNPPKGLGALSLLILFREMMDWGRFKNRRQVGSFTGLVPSEGSTGLSRRLGSVTKVGNPTVRAILVEMAWRLVRLQPNCHAVRKWLPALRDRHKKSASARKKAIVALARTLAVDLWRLATGQTTPAKLGLA